MSRSLSRGVIAALAVLFLQMTAQAAETPKEAVGFFGKVTGVVTSAQADGLSFSLKVTTAEPDAKQSAVKDAAPMVGKVLTLGTRMPKKDGKPYPHPDDIAFIKSLKPGTTVTVKIFAVRSDPRVLRLTAPGEVAPAKEEGK